MKRDSLDEVTDILLKGLEQVPIRYPEWDFRARQLIVDLRIVHDDLKRENAPDYALAYDWVRRCIVALMNQCTSPL